ncbi:hypothetical protein BEN47_17205 [Hymenobacter lapidarius]|uniref:Uncharacterized protein n=1 Tax=Hymenobacter lapidarius TaxID=1908237 RepID=A0A1G1SYP6_9BACT|nr:hypothetical protein [Hymenobacter lapidarius]OGX83741.1 hypothetical protein BEN47_17205 [Hymenobacter lapidarius]
MRFRLLLLLLPVLLGACSKKDQPVQLDFIGSTTLTSGNRVVSPNDTLRTRVFAVGNDNLLQRLRVTVSYSFGLFPYLYPVPISGFDPKNAPGAREVVYMDSLISPILNTPTYTSPYRGGEFLFENRFSARSTSGTELWQYTATDAASESAARAYRLTVRKPDSAAVFHNYTALIRPLPGSPVTVSALPVADRPLRNRARVFLNLRSGLLLPKYSLLNKEASLQSNQPLVDVICVSNAANTIIRLDSPAADSLKNKLSAASWPVANRRRTRLLRTSLTATTFAAASTTTAFATAFANGQPFTADSLSTGPLVNGSVVAFRTGEGYFGLLLVANLVPGTSPLLNCTVRVQK